MTTIFAIDPGTRESGWVLYENDKPFDWAVTENSELALKIAANRNLADVMAIESIASYGMIVGSEVFETCVWTGRFIQAWEAATGTVALRVYRKDVKLHLCGSPRAKDTNIVHAIYDLYGGSRKAAVGVKSDPGPLHGFTSHCWQALAVAITTAETRLEDVA